MSESSCNSCVSNRMWTKQFGEAYQKHYDEQMRVFLEKSKRPDNPYSSLNPQENKK